MTDIEIIDESVEHITFPDGTWLYHYRCSYRKVGMKNKRLVVVNAMLHEHCTDMDKNLATLALNVQVIRGEHEPQFSDISEVSEKFKDTNLWLVSFPGISFPPRILVSDDHRFIRRKLKFAAKKYLDEIRNGLRDWWSGKSV